MDKGIAPSGELDALVRQLRGRANWYRNTRIGQVKSPELLDAAAARIECAEELLTLAQNWMTLLVNKSATARDPGFAEALWKIEGYLLKSDAPPPPKEANP